MSYRKAKCIELYETGVALATKEEGYGSTILAGRPEWATRAVYKMPLIDILRAAEFLGAVDPLGNDIKKIIETNYNSHQSAEEDFVRKSYTPSGEVKWEKTERGVRVECYEMNIYRRIEDVGGETTEFKIIELEVDVLAANLVSVRITQEWSGNEEPDVSEMIYSGPFAVWWE